MSELVMCGETDIAAADIRISINQMKRKRRRIYQVKKRWLKRKVGREERRTLPQRLSQRNLVMGRTEVEVLRNLWRERESKRKNARMEQEQEQEQEKNQQNNLLLNRLMNRCYPL